MKVTVRHGEKASISLNLGLERTFDGDLSSRGPSISTLILDGVGSSPSGCTLGAESPLILGAGPKKASYTVLLGPRGSGRVVLWPSRKRKTPKIETDRGCSAANSGERQLYAAPTRLIEEIGGQKARSAGLFQILCSRDHLICRRIMQCKELAWYSYPCRA